MQEGEGFETGLLRLDERLRFLCWGLGLTEIYVASCVGTRT